jgi:hypothetical protein
LLKVLSFTDFDKEFLIMGSKEELGEEKLTSFAWNFGQKKFKTQPFCLISAQDPESSLTLNLTETYFRRLVNCARLTLHGLISNSKLNLLPDLNGLLSDYYRVDESKFDVLFVLKPFQVPTESKLSKNQEISVFPVVNYDPIELFWNTIQETFGQKEAQFYYNSNCLKIGMKLNNYGVNAKAMMEDIQVLGKELIKECIINIKF